MEEREPPVTQVEAAGRELWGGRPEAGIPLGWPCTQVWLSLVALGSDKSLGSCQLLVSQLLIQLVIHQVLALLSQLFQKLLLSFLDCH